MLSDLFRCLDQLGMVHWFVGLAISVAKRVAQLVGVVDTQMITARRNWIEGVTPAPRYVNCRCLPELSGLGLVHRDLESIL